MNVRRGLIQRAIPSCGAFTLVDGSRASPRLASSCDPGATWRDRCWWRLSPTITTGRSVEVGTRQLPLTRILVHYGARKAQRAAVSRLFSPVYEMRPVSPKTKRPFWAQTTPAPGMWKENSLPVSTARPAVRSMCTGAGPLEESECQALETVWVREPWVLSPVGRPALS